MAEEQSKKKPGIDTPAGRWLAIRECRVPTTYHGKTNDRHPDGVYHVNAGDVKSVLGNFAQWPLDYTIRPGLDRVCYETQIPLRTVNNAVRVLREHGLLIREKQAWMGAPKVTKLNWEKIEALREPYRRQGTPGEIADENEDPAVESTAPEIETDDDVPELVAPMSIATAVQPTGLDEVVEGLKDLLHVGDELEKLPVVDVTRLATRLVKRYGEDLALHLCLVIPETKLEKAVLNAENLPAYLPTVFEDFYTAWKTADIDTLWSKVRSREVWLSVSQTTDDQRRLLFERWGRVLRQLAPDDITVGDVYLHPDGDCWAIDLGVRTDQAAPLAGAAEDDDEPIDAPLTPGYFDQEPEVAAESSRERERREIAEASRREREIYERRERVA